MAGDEDGDARLPLVDRCPTLAGIPLLIGVVSVRALLLALPWLPLLASG